MNTVTPRVSVIIPAFNSAHSLKACLDSVLAQGITDWEAIVVDDGSDDETEAVVRAAADQRIRYVRQENAGQGAARNRGLERARGDFIAFLDADDEWRPGFLERTVQFLADHPEAIAVSTAFSLRYADGREVQRPSGMVGTGIARILPDFMAFWADHDHVRTGTALIRRAVIAAAGPQRADLRISQDLEYWGFLATFGPWGFISEPLWVGNSRLAAGKSGWRRKYAARRRLCPTVEEWEQRLGPRISLDQQDAFRRVRGRVAAGYTHHMIAGGLDAKARQVIGRYGADMPDHWAYRLLRIAARSSVSWAAACSLVRFKEWLKSVRLGLMAR